MNQTIYQDQSKNAIRFSEFNKLEVETPFTGLGIKYVATGQETYFANDKKFWSKKVNTSLEMISHLPLLR